MVATPFHWLGFSRSNPLETKIPEPKPVQGFLSPDGFGAYSAKLRRFRSATRAKDMTQVMSLNSAPFSSILKHKNPRPFGLGFL